jgi:hypothetical protein
MSEFSQTTGKKIGDRTWKSKGWSGSLADMISSMEQLALIETYRGIRHDKPGYLLDPCACDHLHLVKCLPFQQRGRY